MILNGESFGAARLHVAAAAGLVLLCAPALGEPTQAQIGAIRSSCQSDYRANCASVPPGGSAALACLRSNLANLSAACQKAVNAASPAPRLPRPRPCRACPHNYSSAGSSDSSGARRRRARCGASACSRASASGPAGSGGGKARCT